MNMYTPDKWTVVKIETETKTIYKVFGCWYGGYTGSDSWRLNSGVTSVTKFDDRYCFSGSSGSVYVCIHNSYGTSGYGQSVLQEMIKNSSSNCTITIMPEDTEFHRLDYT